MTVVAYKDGIIAADSQLTDTDGVATFGFQKIIKLDGGIHLGITGTADFRALQEMLEKIDKPEKLPTKEQLTETRNAGEFLVVFPNKKAYVINIAKECVEGTDSDPEWDATVEPVIGPVAIGSGACIATGALIAGVSAEEAVALTISNHAYCGGEIQKMKVRNVRRKRIQG